MANIKRTSETTRDFSVEFYFEHLERFYPSHFLEGNILENEKEKETWTMG